jgi:hypothetical protein
MKFEEKLKKITQAVNNRDGLCRQDFTLWKTKDGEYYTMQTSESPAADDLKIKTYSWEADEEIDENDSWDENGLSIIIEDEELSEGGKRN